jgi:hypothetical protein
MEPSGENNMMADKRVRTIVWNLWCFLERAEREEKMFPGLPKTSLHTS